MCEVVFTLKIQGLVSLLLGVSLHTFPTDHGAFTFRPPSVVADTAGAFDHSVAGDKKGNRVVTNSGANRALSGWFADFV